MNNYYLTFSSKHKHPTDSTQSLISYWVRITSENETIAIGVANTKYRNKWEAIYPEHEFDKQYFYGGELEHIVQHGKAKENT